MTTSTLEPTRNSKQETSTRSSSNTGTTYALNTADASEQATSKEHRSMIFGVPTTNGNEELEFSGLTREQEIEEISKRGYRILERIGEGHTRYAFRVLVERGHVKRTMIMKIPKREIDTNSICTMINQSKGDLDKREVSITNGLLHPNIIRGFDSFTLSDGRTVNVEDDLQGTDLEALVKISGPIREPKIIKKLGIQLFDALAYAHNKRVLHRDVKPSNWYMQKEGEGLLGDWQTAAKLDYIQELTMPTRGGTQHTLPTLLNSLLTGIPSCASRQSDIYSAASTLYFALTGKDAFDYKIVEDSNGREIEINGKTVKVALKTSDSKDSEKITPEYHKEKIKKALKALPFQYRSFFKKAFTLNQGENFSTAEEARKYWEKVHENPLPRMKENIVNSLKYALPSAIASGFIALCAYGIATRDNEPKPTMVDILRTEDYTKFSLTDRLNENNPDWTFNGEELTKKAKYAQKHLAEAEQAFEKDFGSDINDLKTFAKNVHRIEPRLVLSWARACYLSKTDRLAEDYRKTGNTRLGRTLTPERFMQVNDFSHGISSIEKRPQIAFGVIYLKQCIDPNKTVADVFADYFCSREEVNTARMRTQSLDYLATVKSNTINVGYSKMIDPSKAEIITTALALYMVTDEDGNVNWDKFPKYYPSTFQGLTMPEAQGYK